MDGCRGGWLVAERGATPGQWRFELVTQFAHVVDRARAAAAVAVDIPIGLRDDYRPRPCDLAARQLLGRRASSIFLAPARELLTCRTHAEASALSRARCGQGISIQAFWLFAKIAEVDAFVPLPRVFEAHPELAFRALAGWRDLPGKRTPEGYAARRALLGGELPERASANRWGGRAAPDDVLDAAILAEVAWRRAHGQAQCAGDPADGAIWY